MDSVVNNPNFQEVIYERLQEEILHGKYPGSILQVLSSYDGRINKSIFEGTDWKNLGGTLMHCLMGRMTWVQLDYYDIQYPDLDQVKYLIAAIRYIIETYDPDLAAKDKEGKTMVDIIKTEPNGESPLTPLCRDYLVEMSEGREFLGFIGLKVEGFKMIC